MKGLRVLLTTVDGWENGVNDTLSPKFVGYPAYTSADV